MRYLLVYGGGLVLVVAACVLPYLAYLAVRGMRSLARARRCQNLAELAGNDNGKETSQRRSASICGPRLPGRSTISTAAAIRGSATSICWQRSARGWCVQSVANRERVMPTSKRRSAKCEKS